MDYGKLIDIGSKVSLAVVLMLILYTGSTGIWVFGSQYKELQSDRDTWKQLALKGTNLAQETSRSHVVGALGPVNLPPLPTDAKASDVEGRLHVIENLTKYKTEPTDLPQ